MSNDDFDPVLFGRVLERLEMNDRTMRRLIHSVENMNEEIVQIKTQLTKKEAHTEGVNKVLLAGVAVASFIIGLLVEVWIFRGPGHP